MTLPEKIADKSDNELIAEFMGAERREGPRFFNPEEKLVQWIIKGNPYNQHRDDILHWYQPVELKYHESWDWLMPVVEKIEDTDDYTAIHIDKNSVYLHFPHTKMLDFPFESGGKITAVYNAVLDFIKWYNSKER